MLPFRESEAASPAEALVRYFKVGRRDLVYLKFILEAYEGMSTLSTVKPDGVIVRLSIPSGFETAIQGILDSVSQDIPIQEVNFAPGEAQHA